ncbi:MAG: HAMP domain-containing protein, partial [Proteobacteria bacterium]|nr:HAMP domain-containing protein [Pseudomonadota bacterium]
MKAEIKNPERVKAVQGIAAEIVRYLGGIEQVAVLKSNEAKIVSEVMDRAGGQIRGELEALAAGATRAGNSNAAILAQAALVEAMQLRLAVNKTIGRNDKALFEQIHKIEAALESVLSALDGATRGASFRKNYDSVRGLLSQYEEGFERVHAIDEELEKLIDGEMKKAAQNIAAHTRDIKTGAIADQDSVQTDVERNLSRNKLVTLVLLLGSLGLGIVLAFFIGGSIAKPVIGMTQAMNKLAGGDTALEIPGIGRGDEIGAMADAVQVFNSPLTKSLFVQSVSGATMMASI